MEKKYEFSEETLEIDDHILHRIVALKDFSDVKKGELGGFVEKESNLAQEGDCWIYDDAAVYNGDVVYGDAMIWDKARIFDYAVVYNNARINDSAEICDIEQTVYYRTGVEQGRWFYSRFLESASRQMDSLVRL